MKKTVDLKARDLFVAEVTGCKIPDKYDHCSFEGMGGKDARMAIDLGYADPEERQNDAPTIGEITDFLEANPSFAAHGYLIGHRRDDTRISFEGVMATKRPSQKEVKAYVEMFRRADEFEAKMPYRAWFD